MKVIFLDIDGTVAVIQKEHDEYCALFEPHFEANLCRLISATGAKVVISSSRRSDGLSQMQNMWKHRGLAGEVIDTTPGLHLKRGGSIQFWNDKLSEIPTPKVHGYSIPRGCEIEYWLKNESQKFGEVESYVILDDDTDFLLNQKDFFVQCSGDTNDEDCVDIGYGLTTSRTDRAIYILNNVKVAKVTF